MDLLRLITDWGALVGVLGLVVAYIFTIYGKNFFLVRNESDRADDRLISLLQGTVRELERNQTINIESITSLSSRVTDLESRNKIMSDVLQGKDEGTKTFQAAAYEAMKRTEDILKVCVENNIQMLKLYESMNKMHQDISLVVNKL